AGDSRLHQRTRSRTAVVDRSGGRTRRGLCQSTPDPRRPWQRLLRKRGELLERPCAHLYETGGLRRAYVRGHENVLKRLLIHARAFNLGLWMRTLFGIGTPRALQGRVLILRAVLSLLWTLIDEALAPIWTYWTGHRQSGVPGSL